MNTLDLVIYYLPLLGVTVSILYYAMVLRNSNRTRSAQLFMSLHSLMSDMEGMSAYLDTMYMEWEDYDDYERRYGSDYNPDNYAKRMTVWTRFDWMGMLLRRGLIDRDVFFELNPGMNPLQHWTKFKDIIREMRRRYNVPMFGTDFEYLAEENRKYMLEKGIDPTVPETFYRYVPDEQ